MTTTQAFRTALHIPVLDPLVNQAVVTLGGGDDYPTGWISAGGQVPPAVSEGQVVVSGPGPLFAWVLTAPDAGVF